MKRYFCTRILMGTFLIAEDFYSLWNGMLKGLKSWHFVPLELVSNAFFIPRRRERLWKPIYLNWLQTLKIANLWIGLNQIRQVLYSSGYSTVYFWKTFHVLKLMAELWVHTYSWYHLKGPCMGRFLTNYQLVILSFQDFIEVWKISTK